MAIGTPNAPSSPNQQSFANMKVERVTGVTGTSLPFTNVIDSTFYLLFKNGSLVDPSTLTVAGSTITVGTAAISSDVFVLMYHFRS